MLELRPLPRRIAAQATPHATYFWSGSNRAGEIVALAKHGQGVGVAVDALDKGGRALAALEDLAPRKRIIVNVARNGSGKPILMLSRNRGELPEGDAPVRIGGRVLTLGFRKIAVNVARAAAEGANVLADVLRDFFGPDAGERGRGHKVAMELTREGWRMSDVDLERARRSGSPVFVDSGWCLPTELGGSGYMRSETRVVTVCLVCDKEQCWGAEDCGDPQCEGTCADFRLTPVGRKRLEREAS